MFLCQPINEVRIFSMVHWCETNSSKEREEKSLIYELDLFIFKSEGLKGLGPVYVFVCCHIIAMLNRSVIEIDHCILMCHSV